MKSVMKALQQLLLKESIRMMKTQRSNTKENYLTEEGKRKGIDKVIIQNAKV